LFIQHNSASLTINENAYPTLRQDLETHINKMVPVNMAYYLQSFDSADDMPALIKAGLLGNNLTIPLIDAALELGAGKE
jgi:secondary thiamine-phosphate synthase enzyme